MATIHGGRVVARALRAQGVRYLFTLCGGHVMSIYDGCLDEGIEVVDFRHEQSAAHAADGWARVTGKPGVAVVTAGPGVTDAVTAVATARRANVPMVVIGGQGPRYLADMGALQEMNHVELMRPITKWAVSVPHAARLGEYVASAFRVAMANVPGPVFLEMPIDLLFDYVEESEAAVPHASRSEAALAGDPRYIDRALELLARSDRPACLVGSQLWWSHRREALLPFVEAFGMPVYLNGQARGSLPPEHPQFFALTRKQALKAADVVMIFGTPLDFRLGYGRESHINPEATLIQVDLDGSELGRNRAVEVGIVGDTGMVMEQMTAGARSAGVRPERFRSWLSGLREQEAARREAMAAEMASDAVPVNPLRLCREIDAVLTPETTVVGDGGDIVATAASVLRIQRPGHWLDAGPLGTLGAGPGYAMAAKLARPNWPVLVIFGDGAFGLNAMEFEACVRQKINIVGVVGNDAAWTQILRGQADLYGPERTPATRLAPARYERVVEAFGGYGEHVERPERVRPALERALSAGRPALVNVRMGKSEFRKGAISF